MDRTQHIPFMFFGALFLIASGIMRDGGFVYSGTSAAILGVFFLACNVAMFWRDMRP